MPTTGSLQLIEAVTERLDGAPVGERRRWSDEFKERAVAAALEPGVNVSALARRLGISPPQLFGWRKAFLKAQARDVSPGTPVPMVEIVVGGVIIRLSPDLDEAALRRIIRAVRTA
ncbi:transposase [Sagittula marina]|uniref:Transposase n=1 Tax=Sagittula marina TaxID=943940 RepID=A0A7W6DVB6_9RHOB|nr:transposase [Sagittula marina]MBB3988466.1 transposase [Sagittula marina]